MTAFSAIKTALASYGYPAVPGKYEGTQSRYFSYNYADNHGADFGDDDPGCDIADVQVHLFLPIVDPSTKAKVNFLSLQQQVRRSLHEAGFTYPSVTVLREDDTNTWHLVYECEYEEAAAVNGGN